MYALDSKELIFEFYLFLYVDNENNNVFVGGFV